MKKIRFALAQMNPTVGDFSGNVRKIVSWIKRAASQKADLAVFPECAVSGYPVWDLANKKGFVDEGLRGLDRIARATQGLGTAVAVGYIESGAGIPARVQKTVPCRSRNALAWIEKGKIKARYFKRLLPTYDVFLEDIFFEPGESHAIIPWKGLNVGPTICEDIWDDNYTDKPLRDLYRKNADLAINISASPYYRGVSDERDNLLKRQAVRYGLPILYVNQTGAQDDLIFDGRSLFVNAYGRVLARFPAFREGLFFYDWQRSRPAEEYSMPADTFSGQPEEIYHALVMGIRDYCLKNDFRKVLIGLSGGIDSALVAVLAVQALGPRAVLGVTMPGEYSSRGSWEDSADLARRLGIEMRTHPIRKKYRFFLKEFSEQGKRESGKKRSSAGITLAMENLQARLRGLELMYLSNDEGRLLLTTGNKSELAMGYCTLYGDMAGGLCVLGDVYKTEIYRLARFCNRGKEIIPETILTKAPSAELRPHQTDQDSLPPYEILDQILYLYIERNLSASEIRGVMKDLGVTAKCVLETIRKVDHNEYKRRQTPPILRVTEKAWFGRRMPITNHFERK